MSCSQVRSENVALDRYETHFAVKYVPNNPAWADDGCSDPFGENAIHKIFLGNLLFGAVRTEFVIACYWDFVQHILHC